ncbi:MAG: FRG domain-containing protein [Bacillota bacterium]
MENDVRVNSWCDLNQQMFEGSWQEPLKRFRSNYVYRGLSNASYQLKTSLARLGGEYDRLENHIVRNFRKYAHRDAVSGDSIWNWLTVAQHHGLPTRLLDWTFSPYVAAHFATANIEHYGIDGVIWCVDYVKAHMFLPGSLREILEKEGANGFTVEMLSRAAGALQEFDRLGSGDFVVFFEPPSLYDRIVNQYALFSTISNPTALLDDWLEKHPDLYRRIIIPASLKWEVRDKLDQANITERVLFPGLDGLSLWLKRHYSPSGSVP